MRKKVLIFGVLIALMGLSGGCASVASRLRNPLGVNVGDMRVANDCLESGRFWTTEFGCLEFRRGYWGVPLRDGRNFRAYFWGNSSKFEDMIPLDPRGQVVELGQTLMTPTAQQPPPAPMMSVPPEPPSPPMLQIPMPVEISTRPESRMWIEESCRRAGNMPVRNDTGVKVKATSTAMEKDIDFGLGASACIPYVEGAEMHFQRINYLGNGRIDGQLKMDDTPICLQKDDRNVVHLRNRCEIN